MDTTYFGRRFGVMVLFDSISGKALSVTEVKNENNAFYAEAVGRLKAKGIEIQSIVCDGRYLTRNPQTAAGKELWRLALSLKSSRRTDFESSLKAWLERHQDFLNERTKNPETGKSHYTHPRLRSAYFSLKRNMNNLFVFEEHPDLSIPNTTNLLDRAFAGLKRNLECHHGMSKANKIKFIKDYFSEK